MEREPIIDSKTAGTIATNLLLEGGTAGGNPLAEKPEVRAILEDLRDISPQQIKEILVFLSNGSSF